MKVDTTIKNFSIKVLLLFCMMCACQQLQAQDSVSSADVQFTPAPSAAQIAKPKPAARKIVKSKKHEHNQTLWAIFLAGIASGFAALLMPCIFPMLPLTVSYF